LPLLVWIVWENVRTAEQVDGLVWSIVLGSLFSAAITIVNYAEGVTVSNSARVTAGEYDVNDLALGLVVAAALCLFLIRSRTRVFERYLAALIIPVLLFATLLTSSRGAAVATAVGVATATVLPRQGRRRRALVVLAVMIVAVPLGIAVLPAANVSRAFSIVSSASTGFDGRFALWSAAWTTIRAHLWVGIGANAFPAVSANLVGEAFYPHDVFLEMWAELGVLGILLPLALIKRLTVLLRRLTDRRRANWIVVYLSLFTGILVLNWEVRQLLWLLLALGIADAHRGGLSYTGNRAPGEDALFAPAYTGIPGHRA
jgi:O-antigen ligase